MDEVERPSVGEQLHGDERIECLGGRTGLDIGELGGMGELSSRPEHGRRGCQLARRRRKAAHAQEDRVRDRGGEHPLNRARGVCGGLDFVRGRRPQELLEQERTARARRQAGGGELRARLAQRLGHEVGDRLATQRPGPKQGNTLLRGQLACVLRGRSRLACACGDDHGHRHSLDPAREVEQETQRDLVAPVDVVDHERQWPLLGQVRSQPVEPMEHRNPGLGALLGRRGAHESSGELGGSREECRSLLGRRLDDDGLEQLAREAAAEAALELGASRSEHVESVLGGQLRGGIEKRRLADARGPLDQHDRPRPVANGSDCRLKLSQLCIALQETDAVT
jgi:hypothetical protein